MSIKKKAIWLCGSGEGKDYSNVCLKLGVIMIGPGDAGRYPECLDKIKPYDKQYVTLFAEKIKTGDIVILKHGPQKVICVGEIVSDYQYNKIFGNGTFPEIGDWDISHCRRVLWLWDSGYNFPTDTLGTDRIRELPSTDETVTTWLKGLTFTGANIIKGLAELPA